MVFQRNQILSTFPHLGEKQQPFIVSTHYDGLICAAFLHHYLDWQLAGFYDLTSLWLSKTALERKRELIWVDLNILPREGRSVGGQIVSPAGDLPPGFQSSCNPNILAGVTAREFSRKFPFSTILFLLWLHNTSIPQSFMARLLVLQADDVWLKAQHFPENFKRWQTMLPEYNWNRLFRNITSRNFEKQMAELLYPQLKAVRGCSRPGKLSGKHTGIRSRTVIFNPDWDEDVIWQFLQLFAEHLKWTPPPLPHIHQRLDGHRQKIPLAEVKKGGLIPFLRQHAVFSYAIPAPRTFNFTTFKKNTSLGQ